MRLLAISSLCASFHLSLSHRATRILIHESDVRHNPYDFCAEAESAPPDLKLLTIENESMAFRRRGYERDALLQAVIERANFTDLIDTPHSREQEKQQLATLPEELGRFDLGNLWDRPMCRMMCVRVEQSVHTVHTKYLKLIFL